MPAITSITNGYNALGNRTEQYKEQHGKAVHALMAEMALNGWNIPIRSKSVLPLWVACLYGRREMIRHNAQAIATELPTRLTDGYQSWNGRLDYYGIIDGDYAIVDYKTETIRDRKKRKQVIVDWALQLNAYAWSLRQRGQQVDRLFILWLPPDSKPEFLEIKNYSYGSIIKALQNNRRKFYE